MIRITSNDSVHNCEGASRREFLRVGALGLGGLTLPQLLATRAMAGEGDNILTGKSVVMLNLQGGRGSCSMEFFRQHHRCRRDAR